MIINRLLERIAQANRCEFEGKRLTPNILYRFSHELMEHGVKKCLLPANKEKLPENLTSSCESYSLGVYDPACFLA